MKRIESRDNKWIKRLNGLKIKKNRDKEGLFIAEGLRFIREIPKNWEVLAYAVSDAFAAENDLSPYEEKAEVLCLTDALFAAVCDTENPQGILAVCKKLDWDADAVLAKKTPFLLLAEELNDPGNLGTILRTADALAVPVVLLPGCADVWNPKVVRASMGAAFRAVPVSMTREAAVASCRKNNVRLLATALRADAHDLREETLSQTAVIIGSEGQGVCRELLDAADGTVIIPMQSHCESLNAAVAATIVMWQMRR